MWWLLFAFAVFLRSANAWPVDGHDTMNFEPMTPDDPAMRHGDQQQSHPTEVFPPTQIEPPALADNDAPAAPAAAAPPPAAESGGDPSGEEGAPASSGQTKIAPPANLVTVAAQSQASLELEKPPFLKTMYTYSPYSIVFGGVDCQTNDTLGIKVVQRNDMFSDGSVAGNTIVEPHLDRMSFCKVVETPLMNIVRISPGTISYQFDMDCPEFPVVFDWIRFRTSSGGGNGVVGWETESAKCFSPPPPGHFFEYTQKLHILPGDRLKKMKFAIGGGTHNTHNGYDVAMTLETEFGDSMNVGSVHGTDHFRDSPHVTIIEVEVDDIVRVETTSRNYMGYLSWDLFKANTGKTHWAFKGTCNFIVSTEGGYLDEEEFQTTSSESRAHQLIDISKTVATRKTSTLSTDSRASTKSLESRLEDYESHSWSTEVSGEYYFPAGAVSSSASYSGTKASTKTNTQASTSSSSSSSSSGSESETTSENSRQRMESSASERSKFHSHKVTEDLTHRVRLTYVPIDIYELEGTRRPVEKGNPTQTMSVTADVQTGVANLPTEWKWCMGLNFDEITRVYI